MYRVKFLLLGIFLSFFCIQISAKNKALLVGIGNYDTSLTGWKKLSGNNDVDLLSKKLKSKGFTVTSLKDNKATKKNIISAMRNLVSSARSGDMIYIHFSGHGQLIQDMNNDEPNGFDQSFICYDARFSTNYKINGVSYKGQYHLIDDELFPFINQLKSKVGTKGNIIVAFDSCYSEGNERSANIDDIEPADDIEFSSVTRGTDYEFSINKTAKIYLKSIKKPAKYRRTGGKVVVISACEWNQRNYEVKEKHSGKGYGSLSYCIGKLLDNNIKMGDWGDFFSSNKYKSYNIFRSSQRPTVEIH